MNLCDPRCIEGVKDGFKSKGCEEEKDRTSIEKASGVPESNRRPSDLQSLALPLS